MTEKIIERGSNLMMWIGEYTKHIKDLNPEQRHNNEQGHITRLEFRTSSGNSVLAVSNDSELIAQLAKIVEREYQKRLFAFQTEFDLL